MPKRMTHAFVAAAALATIGLGAAALVQASSSSAEKDEATVTGPQATKAERAALRATKGGTVNAVERDNDGGATWEVEVTKPDGATTDVELDENLKVVASEDDDEGTDERGDNEGERKSGGTDAE
jgi:uncharacterized membrane protein YkoI